MLLSGVITNEICDSHNSQHIQFLVISDGFYNFNFTVCIGC